MDTLRDLMTADPLTIDVTASVKEALELLDTVPIRHLPVLDGDDLVGILSDRDLRPWRQALWDLEDGEGTVAAAAALGQPARKLMRTDVLFLGVDRPLTDAIDVMLDFQVGAVPIVEEGRLVGIVSYVDLLEHLQHLLQAPA